MQTSITRNRNKRRSTPPLKSNMKADGGQSLVELALTMPILIALLVGAVEFGRMAFAGIEVQNAALAGVKYGAQDTTTAADTTGIQSAASADAPDITLGTPTVSISCICADGSASTCVSTDCTTSAIEKIVTVQTQASFTPLIHMLGVSGTFTLHGRAVQKVLE